MFCSKKTTDDSENASSGAKSRRQTRKEREREFLELRYKILPARQRLERKRIREQLGYNPLGRAPLPDSERRDVKITVRFNEREIAALQALADIDGTTLAETIRNLAVEATSISTESR